ncbi:MAG: hypothetical protein KF791_18860, partial [Verrucomicrobiae bacterium]|nr:hypothetical protein [Verrucomicrobiae bacterium]
GRIGGPVPPLVFRARPGNVAALLNERLQRWLPWVFGGVMALTRWPGLMPPNFSAVYAFVFCAGALIPGSRAWSLPLVLLLATDAVLIGYYQWVRGWQVVTGAGLALMAVNYAGYALLFGLGRWLGPTRRWRSLVGGGVLGALVFYLVTNSAAWLFNPFRNPEYTRSIGGWLVALTRGTGGYPQTWEFFRNTLLSGGLFTALFAGAWRLTAGESPVERGDAPATEADPEPEEPAAEAGA